VLSLQTGETTLTLRQVQQLMVSINCLHKLVNSGILNQKQTNTLFQDNCWRHKVPVLHYIYMFCLSNISYQHDNVRCLL